MRSVKQSARILFLLAVLFLWSVPCVFVSAHVGFGEYAGTHVVAFTPTPHSPFTNEEVAMKFYTRTLQGYQTTETFLVSIDIQEVLPNGSERGVFAMRPVTVKNGMYETAYTFEKSGHYRIDYSFWKPEEPDKVRDAVFDIEVRDSLIRSDASLFEIVFTSVIVLFIGFVLGFSYQRFFLKKY